MGKSKGKNYFKANLFLSGLRELVNSFPTDYERHEIQTNLSVLIELFTVIKKNLTILPSNNDLEKLNETINQLEQLIKRAESNTALACIVGLRRQTVRKKRKDISKEDEIEKAKSELTKLETLSIDDIR